MDSLRQLLFRLRALFRRQRLEADMAEEMRAHLELEAAHQRASGTETRDAQFAAQRQFGGMEQAMERCRDERSLAWLEVLRQDTRYALRSLRRQPAFASVVVLTLALGIGASTALFSVIYGVVLQSLPYRDAERLIWLGGKLRNQAAESGVTPADFLDYREQGGSFEALAASISDGVPINLTGDGDPERLKGALVTANFLDVLGVPAALGRVFSTEESQPGRGDVAVLSHGLWLRRFGAEPGVIGREIQLDGRKVTVIGVMSPHFQYPAGVEVWLPVSMTDGKMPMQSRQFHFLRPVGRLRQGVTLAQAQAEFTAIARRLADAFPRTNTDWGIGLVPLQERVVGGIRPTLRLAFGAVACVLMLACVSIASLLLARAAARQREIGVRVALGASRSRVVRQLLTENLVLALLGGVAGVFIAQWGLKLLMLSGRAFIPRAGEVTINLPVLGFALATALLTGVLFGLVPVWDLARVDVNRALADGGRGSTGGARRQRVLRALVMVEVALSAVLLVGGGLLVKSFVRLQAVAPGFVVTNLLTVHIDLPNPYAEPGKKTAFFEQVQERLAALPGVEAVGLVSELPLANQSADAPLKREDVPDAAPASGTADLRSVNDAYFRAMRIPLLRGRDFTPAEVHAGTKVAVISEALAKSFFPNQDPIGRRLRVDPFGKDLFEIVGIVGDVRHRGLDGDLRQTFYYPSLRFGYSNLVIRTQADPTSLAAAVRRTVTAIAPNQPLANVKTMEQWVADSTAQPRFRVWLVGSFSLLALTVAVVGLYGVMAHAVAHRAHEFGVRLALGARPGDLLRLVVEQGMKVTLAGLAAGLLGAWAARSALADILFDVPAHDPLTFATIALLLTVVGLVACYLPARRATKADPMVTLRRE